MTGAALAIATVSLVAVLLDSMEKGAGEAGAVAASLPSMQEAEGEGEENKVFKSTRNQFAQAKGCCAVPQQIFLAIVVL